MSEPETIDHGDAADEGHPDGSTGDGVSTGAGLLPPPADAARHRVWRSTDRVLAGAAGGLADAFGVDAAWTRMAFVVLTLFRGVGVWLYAIAALLLPDGPFARPASRRRRIVAGACTFAVMLVLWDGLETPFGNRFAVPWGPLGLIGSPSGLVLLLAGAAVVLWRRDQPRRPPESTSSTSSPTGFAPPLPPPAAGWGLDTPQATGTWLVEPVVRTPRERRPRSTIGRLALAVAIGLVAVVAAITGGRPHAMQVALGLAALVCGLGLVAAGVGQRARWLVVPAVLALAGSVVASTAAFTGTRIGLQNGSVSYGAATPTDTRYNAVPDVIDRRAGQVWLALARESTSRTITVRIGKGDLDVWVPSDVGLAVDGRYRVGLGAIGVDGASGTNGFDREQRQRSGSATASTVVRLDAAVAVGRIRVHTYSVTDEANGPYRPGSPLPPGVTGTTLAPLFPPVVAVPTPDAVPFNPAVGPGPGPISRTESGWNYADGRVLDPGGFMHYPDGTMVTPTGGIELPDGTQLNVDGSRVYGAGAQVLADGTVVLANGARIEANGTVVLGADGSGPTFTIPPDVRRARGATTTTTVGG